MITLENTGLNWGGFGFDSHSRDKLGVGLGAASLEPAGDNVELQQQLNDFISTSYMMHQGFGQNQCGSLESLVGESSSYVGLPSVGIYQSDIDRDIFFDSLPPVDDHKNPHNYAPVSTVPHAPISSLEFCSSHVVGSLSASSQPQVMGERWNIDEAPTSTRVLKHERSSDDQISTQGRKRLAKSDRTVASKCKRPNEQSEHILRERQRRDDMTSKFAVLESLLPTGTKRDRSAIVDDSIQYVNNLHHRIKELQNRKVELNQSATCLQKVVASRRRKSFGGLQPTSPDNVNEKKAAVQRLPISPQELSRIHTLLRSSLEKMEVHADLPNQVVIEMVFHPQPRLQSNILQCLESLNLDVMQCSITKIAHRLICVVTAQPQETKTPTSGIVGALKSALQGSD
ncbi:uncharacterized protein [Physcomitrium patens]|uniref:BHLH domain-containing protein n=2 Tax=Physcomitrium patens TaxID=3218 RepID=A0A2K1L7G6_PHYPA|nr:transcription factor EGL1-like [Physcomitrium patens]PNR61978.1 hypothetical protein PHYPA_000402 [Physcomitrium patens]|eukprot:XP_024393784.1 transcription factor EGL1-like [Physcomitrella patens]